LQQVEIGGSTKNLVLILRQQQGVPVPMSPKPASNMKVNKE
jgi:hypothetical protein